MSFRIRLQNTPFPTKLNDAQSIYGIELVILVTLNEIIHQHLVRLVM
jgi:hypothetical protein